MYGSNRRPETGLAGFACRQAESPRMATGLSSPAPRDGAALPTGTVTFLFTDIEGSTQRWDAHREAMSAAVQRHEAIVRAAMDAHGGYVLKTVGDAFCVAFARSEDAVAAALDFQRALLTENFAAVDGLRVRAALHTGAADERGGRLFRASRESRCPAALDRPWRANAAFGGDARSRSRRTPAAGESARSRRASPQGSLAPRIRLSARRTRARVGVSGIAVAGIDGCRTHGIAK